MDDRFEAHTRIVRRQILRAARAYPAKSSKPTLRFVMGLCERALGGRRRATDQDVPASLGISLENYKRSSEVEYFPSSVGYDVSDINYPVATCATLASD